MHKRITLPLSQNAKRQNKWRKQPGAKVGENIRKLGPENVNLFNDAISAT
jgi:hypothetical protein